MIGTEAQLAELAKEFRLVQLLGAGGRGMVFLAEQIKVRSRKVALKILRPPDDPRAYSEFLSRFEKELDSTIRIEHENVVRIYDSGGVEEGIPYIAMEFLKGESLRDAVQSRGALPAAECAEILRQAAEGLDAAHALGIIHRDLKPDNLFLTRDNKGQIKVKVVDFGIAKMRESGTQTATGAFLGTPGYASPEQASGMRSDQLDARSDVYSLGVVAYEMLTGRVPFQDTLVGCLVKHQTEPPPPFSTAAPGVSIPPQVETVVMKALAKERDQRHGTVREFAEELARAARPDRPAEPPPPEATAVYSAPVSGRVAGPRPLEVRQNPKDGLNYVWIPPGTFMMGCSPGDNEGNNAEKPAHQVTISKGFWLGQTPVTVGAYKRFATTTRREMPYAPDFNKEWRNDKMPIVNVSWSDAQGCCRWMGGRMPTEAEWEYAARGGCTKKLYGPLDEIAWHRGNSGEQTREVGQKRANNFGLYDMLGNVWEWVYDWYGENFYYRSPSQDPRGPTRGESRVLRGGSWFNNPSNVRVSYRFRWPYPSNRGGSNGFRCAGEVF
jgi:serine/threonine-protein kinase